MGPLPRNPTELTAPWLTEALEQAGVLEGASITEFSMDVIGVGEGFLAQLVRVTLHADRPAPALPATLIAKSCT